MIPANMLKFYINGEWVDPVTPRTLEVQNPANEEAYARISLGSKADVDKAVAAAKDLGPGTRVVSMPSMERFARQPASYRDEVLPPSCHRRVSMEAGVTFGWHRWVGDRGVALGIDHFGASAPAKELFKRYGFTADNVRGTIESVLKK